MVETFEQEIADYFNTCYALATSTGSGAYFCAAAALDFRPGDEVIIPAFGWITNYNMIRLFGARPVFARVDESLNIDPDAIQEQISEKTKAIIAIHYQGGASRLDEIAAIAKENNIFLIEDVAQACGGLYQGKKLGTWGDISCFSLQTRKIITSGDGGFLITNNQELFEKAVRYHDLGMIRPTFEKRLNSPVVTETSLGMQFRMNELTGAVALAQFRKLPSIVNRTKNNYNYIRGKIVEEFPELQFRQIAVENDLGILLAINLGSRDKVTIFKKAFESRGLVYGPTSWCETMGNIEIVRNDLMLHNEYCAEVFQETEKIEEKFASIAVLPTFTRDENDTISKGIIHALSTVNGGR
jgi:8-amino-3,8-dideoxy-alpha-D-manno-octulosonate transaminase